MNLQKNIHLAKTFCTTDEKTVDYVKNVLIGALESEIRAVNALIALVSGTDYSTETLHEDVDMLSSTLVACKERLLLVN